jgi:hypothetical protein
MVVVMAYRPTLPAVLRHTLPNDVSADIVSADITSRLDIG